MSRKCFESILKALSITSHERPAFTDHVEIDASLCLASSSGFGSQVRLNWQFN